MGLFSEVPVLDLNFESTPDNPHNPMFKMYQTERQEFEVAKNKGDVNKYWCIATCVENPQGLIYGNFCKFVKEFPFKNTTKLDLPHVKCLRYTGESSGSFKKVYYGLQDNNGKLFIVTDEIIGEYIFYDDKENPLADPGELNGIDTNIFEKNIKLKLDDQRRELVNHQTFWKKNPNFAPKIYSANIYVGAINESRQLNCGIKYQARLQILMGNAYYEGFYFLKELKSTEYFNEIIPYPNQILLNEKLRKLFLFNVMFDKISKKEGLDMSEYHNFEDEINSNDTYDITNNYTKYGYSEYKRFYDKMSSILTVDNFKNIVYGPFYIDNSNWMDLTYCIIKKLNDSGITHGDLKSDNILFTRDFSEIKIIDFGLSFKHEEYKKELAGIKLYYLKEFVDVVPEEYKEIAKKFVESVLTVPNGWENHPMMMELFAIQKDTKVVKTLFLVNSLFLTINKELITDLVFIMRKYITNQKDTDLINFMNKYFIGCLSVLESWVRTQRNSIFIFLCQEYDRVTRVLG